MIDRDFEQMSEEHMKSMSKPAQEPQKGEPNPAREGRCDKCRREYRTPWFVSNELWNLVVDHDDGWNFLCPDCFMELAEIDINGCTGWQLVPEFPATPAPSQHVEECGNAGCDQCFPYDASQPAGARELAEQIVGDVFPSMDATCAVRYVEQATKHIAEFLAQQTAAKEAEIARLNEVIAILHADKTAEEDDRVAAERERDSLRAENAALKAEKNEQ